MKTFILTIDQGTTSTRAIIFDRQAKKVVMSQKEIKQSYPQPGWVEHDPIEIWNSVQQVVADCFIKSGISPNQIEAIGITNQRETTLIWDKITGLPVYPAIVWQSRQTVKITEDWIEAGYEQLIYDKTGLVIDPYFSASKIKWILNHVEGSYQKASKGQLLFGTIDTWLLWKLTGGKVHATDITNASRTLFFNIHRQTWDQELLEIFGIPEQMLGQVKTNSEIFGYTDTYLFEGQHIPIASLIGDQHAALFGQLAIDKGAIKTTYGTGAFIMMNTGDRPVVSDHRLLTTIGYQIGDKPTYALEGSIFVAGSAVQWLRDGLNLIGSSAEIGSLANLAQNDDSLYLVPAFTGLGAPYWDSLARGAFLGITRSTNQADIAKAVLQSIAYQVHDIISTMEKDTGIEIAQMRVDGGASENDFLLQFQADILDQVIDRCQEVETTALGAAFMAGLAVNYWNCLDQIQSLNPIVENFSPSIDHDKRKQLLQGWHKAVRATRYFAHDQEEN